MSVHALRSKERVSTRFLLLAIAILVIVFFMITGTDIASAAADSERVGKNISDLLGGWARSLYVGIAAIVSIMFLLKRNFAEMAVFMGAAVLVGGFVMAPNDVADMIRGIWTTVTSGT